MGGDVILKPGAGGTVFIAGTDLRKFIEVIYLLPTGLHVLIKMYCPFYMLSLNI